MMRWRTQGWAVIFVLLALFMAVGAAAQLGVERAFQQLRPITISTSSCLLRVMQFNTLADGLFGLRADKGFRLRCSQKAADWEHRKHLLIDELTRYDPDVVRQQINYITDCSYFSSPIYPAHAAGDRPLLRLLPA